jgi:hypothetical protein
MVATGTVVVDTGRPPPGAKSARLKRDFKGARKAFWIEYDFGPAELILEGTLDQV